MPAGHKRTVTSTRDLPSAHRKLATEFQSSSYNANERETAVED